MKPARTPTRPRPATADLPMAGLYRVQRNQMLQAAGLPILFWLLPWPQPLALVGFILPPLALLLNLGLIALIKCPACNKMLMVKGLAIFPRRRCPHCRETVA
jgi:hypothetical protein